MEKTLKNRIKVKLISLNIKRKMWTLNGYKFVALTNVKVNYDWDTNVFKVFIQSEVPHHTASVIKALFSGVQK